MKINFGFCTSSCKLQLSFQQFDLLLWILVGHCGSICRSWQFRIRHSDSWIHHRHPLIQIHPPGSCISRRLMLTHLQLQSSCGPYCHPDQCSRSFPNGVATLLCVFVLGGLLLSLLLRLLFVDLSTTFLLFGSYRLPLTPLLFILDAKDNNVLPFSTLVLLP